MSSWSRIGHVHKTQARKYVAEVHMHLRVFMLYMYTLYSMTVHGSLYFCDCTSTHCTTIHRPGHSPIYDVEMWVFRGLQQGARVDRIIIIVCRSMCSRRVRFQACQRLPSTRSPCICWGQWSGTRRLSRIIYTTMAWLLGACHIAHVSMKHPVRGNCHRSSLHPPYFLKFF